jgi:flagellar biosynthesis protein FlhF
MMQVKKYRAATTREALEQIKQELGQDAFVLETKQVRKGGFLGLGKSTEIEISAAAAPGSSRQNSEMIASSFSSSPKKTAKTSRAAAPKMLLLDDAPAAPTANVAAKVAPAVAAPAMPAFLAAEEAEENDDILEILAARNTETEEAPAAYTLGSIFAGRPARFETAELSPEAPQLVHKKKATAKTAQMVEAETAPQAATPDSYVAASARELEFLRAELREVKFTLGKIAHRTKEAEYQRDHDHEFLGGNYESPYHEAYVELATLGVPAELAKCIVLEIIPELRGSVSQEEDIARLALTSALGSRLTFVPSPLQPDNDRVIAFVGPTGVGKTTTIAKLAARVALQQGRRVELIALDTYRIGAVEQLKTYAEIIGAGCHTVRSVLELDALLRRLPQDAVVLIDSTGRSPHDLADQMNLAEYLRHNEDIKKCLVIQATTHPVDAASAMRKFATYGPDYLAVTKFDETERPGALLEAIAESELPLAYFCNGQRVPEDLQEATLKNLVTRIFPDNN